MLLLQLPSVLPVLDIFIYIDVTVVVDVIDVAIAIAVAFTADNVVTVAVTHWYFGNAILVIQLMLFFVLKAMPKALACALV